MHSIFQIRISRNAKCVDMTGFSRPAHIFVLKYFVGTLDPRKLMLLKINHMNIFTCKFSKIRYFHKQIIFEIKLQLEDNVAREHNIN